MDETPKSDQKQTTTKRATIIALSLFIGMVVGGVAVGVPLAVVRPFETTFEVNDDDVVGWIVISLTILSTFLGGVAGVIAGEKLSRRQ